jgi:predicted metal-dependent hydrolase
MALLRRTPRLQPDDVVEIDGRPVRLAVQPRARRVSLRLDPSRREVIATAPSLRRLPEALAFAQTRADRIAARLASLPAPALFRPGATVSVGGEPCRLERAAMRIKPRLIPRTAEEPMRLLAWGDPPTFNRAAERALRTEALGRLTERTSAYAQALDQAEPSVAVMDARGRWGSCRPPHRGEPGRIRYNWRLILAPPFVLDYVAAHECAHLVEANHGPGFWAVVDQLFGDPRAARAWLKAHGAALHALGRG